MRIHFLVLVHNTKMMQLSDVLKASLACTMKSSKDQHGALADLQNEKAQVGSCREQGLVGAHYARRRHWPS